VPLSGAWLPNHGHDVSGKGGRHVLQGRKQSARISMLSKIGTLLVDHRRRVAQLRPRL
jgi:hypothetical protein